MATHRLGFGRSARKEQNRRSAAGGLSSERCRTAMGAEEWGRIRQKNDVPDGAAPAAELWQDRHGYSTEAPTSSKSSNFAGETVNGHRSGLFPKRDLGFLASVAPYCPLNSDTPSAYANRANPRKRLRARDANTADVLPAKSNLVRKRRRCRRGNATTAAALAKRRRAARRAARATTYRRADAASCRSCCDSCS